MRPRSLLLVSLVSVGCSNSFLPASDLQGTWGADFHVIGSGMTLDLTQSGSSVAGSGSYSMEAGRAGTLQVSGRYVRPSVTLRLVFDYGHTEIFAGTVLDSQHMRGTVSDSTGIQAPLSFTRR